MSETGNHSANIGATSDGADVIPLPRRRGKPKGLPKPPGSGRKKGTPNRRTVRGAEYLRTLNPKAKARLRKIIEGDDAELALKAAQLVLAYTYGRPIEAREITGADGAPLYASRDDSPMEVARDMLFAIELAKRSGRQSDDEADDEPASTAPKVLPPLVARPEAPASPAESEANADDGMNREPVNIAGKAFVAPHDDRGRWSVFRIDGAHLCIQASRADAEAEARRLIEMGKI